MLLKPLRFPCALCVSAVNSYSLDTHLKNALIIPESHVLALLQFESMSISLAAAQATTPALTI
jgi:hypothetical protein